VAGAELIDDARNLLGGILQIRVERDDPATAYDREAGDDRRVLAEVPGQLDDDDLRMPAASSCRMSLERSFEPSLTRTSS